MNSLEHLLKARLFVRLQTLENCAARASMAAQSALMSFWLVNGDFFDWPRMRPRIMWRDGWKFTYLASNIIDPAFLPSRPRRFRTRCAAAISNEPVVEAEFIKVFQSRIDLLDWL